MSGSAADDDDAPPPLEDMSAYVKEKQQQQHQLQQHVREAQLRQQLKEKEAAAAASAAAAAAAAPKPAATASSASGSGSGSGSSSSSSSSSSSGGGGGGMFSGLKGGFFNRPPPAAPKPAAAAGSSAGAAAAPAAAGAPAGAPAKPKAKAPERLEGGAKESILNVVTPAAAASEKAKKHKHKNDEKLRMPEVQAAMQSGAAGAAGAGAGGGAANGGRPAWVTNDLLHTVASNPILLAGLQNPKIVSAMADVQKDATAALKKHGADKELGKFIQEWMKVMGGHMEQMADKEAKEKADQQKQQQKAAAAAAAAGAGDPTAPVKKGGHWMFGERAVDERQLQQWMTNPVIRAVLNDPNMTGILSALGKDRKLWPKYSAHPGVRLLVQAGILEVPPEYRL